MCPIGMYGNRTGLAAQAECTQCDPGFYCDRPGLTAPFASCYAGFYCELGATAPNPDAEAWGYHCPAGSNIFVKSLPWLRAYKLC